MATPQESLSNLCAELNADGRARLLRDNRILAAVATFIGATAFAVAAVAYAKTTSPEGIAGAQAHALSRKLDEQCSVGTFRIRSMDLEKDLRGQAQVEVYKMTDPEENCFDRVKAALPLTIDGCAVAYSWSGWSNPASQTQRFNVMVDCATRYGIQADFDQ